MQSAYLLDKCSDAAQDQQITHYRLIHFRVFLVVVVVLVATVTNRVYICQWQINSPLQHPHLATILGHTHTHRHKHTHKSCGATAFPFVQSIAQWRISCDAFQGFTQITRQQQSQAPSRALTLRVVYSTYK